MERLLASAISPGLPVGLTVLVPVGSTEQHGPHLPLDTDTVIAVAVANRAADSLVARGLEVVVAPALAYGSSGEHQGFAGTSSIGTDALHAVLVELVRSMGTWAARIVFVNAHGGNVVALRGAVAQLVEEGHQVAWVPCAPKPPSNAGADLHAGRTETSLMLHLAPWHVRLTRAEAGNTRSLEELLPLMVAGGVKAVSANGVLGNPYGASGPEGASILESMVQHVTWFVARMP